MAVKRIMCYLQGTLLVKLKFGGHHMELKEHCNVDRVGDANDRRSTSGYAFFLTDKVVP